MLVDCANHKAKLFYPLRTPYNHEDRKEFAQLVSLLNFIDVLEQKGLIYLQPTNAGCELFFYENFKHSFLHGIQKNDNVKEAISQQEQIIYDTDEYEVIDMQGVKVPKVKSDFLFIARMEFAPCNQQMYPVFMTEYIDCFVAVRFLHLPYSVL